MTDPDLIYGFGVMIGISTILFLVGVVVGGRISRAASLLTLTLTVLLIVAYLIFLWDDILLAKLLPFSNLIVVGNWLPPLTGFIAGVAWKSMPGSLRRRNSYTAVEIVIALLAMVVPLWGETPECHNAWTQGICLQTSTKTCSAASAATLLRLHGITATEDEMARLCLTNGEGTSWQGLYRGLKIKTRGTRFDVQVLSCKLHELAVLADTPVILVVGIPEGVPVDQKYLIDDGWGIGELHSVVFLRFLQNGNASIGDPEVGLLQWTWDDLKLLVRGRAVRLIERAPQQTEYSAPES